MNISHEWLKTLVPHTRSAEEVRDLLTAHVATVEGFEHTRADLAPFVVARVVESEKIPETKLSFNKVDDGSGTLLEVVCGAPNVTVGTMYPFARTGTTMPAGLVIEKRKIRGFTSNGMLCSARELGLGQDHDGILPLETDAAPGTPLLSVLPISDVRLVVDVLPNRPDLLSHRGVAREIAAITGVAMVEPAEMGGSGAVPAPVTGDAEASAPGITVRLADREGCPRYGAAVVRGVKVGPSPEWLVKRLEAIGSRSINNVVDATNYLLHGFGHPMHAFDLAKIGGATIVVRRANDGEVLTTLDGTERKLTSQMLVIADAERATAVAGVMGGRDSEVTDATTDILLEVASFHAGLVRKGRRALGLSTDASYRFERGVDDAALPELLARGAAFIAAVAGGTVERTLLVGAEPAARVRVEFAPSRVARLLGDAVPPDEVVSLLTSIGFTVSGSGDSLSVLPPSWRHDVTRDVDLVEEVARLRGYDRLPDTLTGARPGNVPDHPMHTLGRRVRDALVAEGLFEIRPLPFTKQRAASQARVLNPLAQDEAYLRLDLLDTLSRRAEYNLNRMQGNVRLFEVGTAFLANDGAETVRGEEIRVGALIMGASRPPHFTEPKPPAFDAWDAKALALTIAGAAWPGAEVALVARPDDHRDADGAPSLLWTVMVDGTERGHVSALTGLDAPNWAAPAYGVELTLGAMPAEYVAAKGANAHADASAGTSGPAVTPVRFVPLPAMPAAEFDLALLVPSGTSAATVENTIREAAGDLLESLVVFDEYRGQGLPAGTRSVGWRLTFRHPERTLRDKEIDGRRSMLLKTLEKIGVVPRSA